MKTPAHKGENELNSLALKICQTLHSVPLGQALWLVEKQVPLLLKDGHIVNTSGQRFKAMKAGLQHEAKPL